MPEERKTIGGMNGPWALLLRLALASHPFVVAWLAWVTSQQFRDISFREHAFTKIDAAELEARIQVRLSALPGDEWKARLVGVEEQTTLARVALADLAAKQGELYSRQADTLRVVERIEQRLAR